MKEKLFNYLEHVQYLPLPEKSEFTGGQSTDTALFQHISQMNAAIGVYLDLKNKTFDTVNHVKLIENLHKTSIKDPLLGWFTTYLHERKQVVKYSQSNIISRISY